MGLTCVLSEVWIPASDSDDALEMSLRDGWFPIAVDVSTGFVYT